MFPLFAYYFRFCSANCFAQQTTFPQIHGGIHEYLLSFINISPQKDLLSSSDNQQYVLLSFLLNFFFAYSLCKPRLFDRGWTFKTILLCLAAVNAEYNFLAA